MREVVARDLAASSHDFLHVVCPVLLAHCRAWQGSEVRLVEGKHDLLALDLDRCAGIDAYQRQRWRLRGVASRVQWASNYRTFTVRFARPNGIPTEYEKRLAVVKRRDEGYFYPFWNVQAYLSKPGGPLLSVGMAKTTELLLYIEHCVREGPALVQRPTGDGEHFLIVPWEQYRQTGNYLFTYPS